MNSETNFLYEAPNFPYQKKGGGRVILPAGLSNKYNRCLRKDTKIGYINKYVFMRMKAFTYKYTQILIKPSIIYMKHDKEAILLKRFSSLRRVYYLYACLKA